MMVMFGANGNPTAYYLIGAYRGKVGMLMGPSRMVKPRHWMPFACDNDRFIAWRDKSEWSEPEWIKMLHKIKSSGHRPLWVAVPDVVMDAAGTLNHWGIYYPIVKRFGFPAAFVVQDGHTPGDVPKDACLVFVGGSTEFKYRTLPMWCSNFPRVHVGRVNEIWRLERLVELGVESCDGSGWFRDTDEGRRIRGLEAFLDGSNIQYNLL